MGWKMGFEPTVSSATNWRFNQLSYIHQIPNDYTINLPFVNSELKKISVYFLRFRLSEDIETIKQMHVTSKITEIAIGDVLYCNVLFEKEKVSNEIPKSFRDKKVIIFDMEAINKR